MQLFLGSTLLAATAPSYLAPANSFMYLEANTTQANPLKDQLETLLKETAGAVENQTTLDTIAKNLDNTTMGLSTSYHLQDGSDIYFFSIALAESDFQIILDELGDNDLTSKDIGQQKMIYLTGDDFYFTYKDGNLLASNKEGMISDLLLIHEINSVGKGADWQFLNSKSTGREFFRALINFRNFPENSVETNDLGTLPILDLIESEGFAVEQTTNGLKGLVTVKPGSVLTGLIENTAFVPELYTKVNAEGILLYTESSNWAKDLEMSMQMFSAMSDAPAIGEVEDLYTAFREAIVETTGLDMETDIKPLFRSRSAFFMHDESLLQYAPSFTLVSEVKGLESTANGTLNKMHEKIIASMTESFNTMYDQEVGYREKLAELFADDPTYIPSPLPERSTLMKEFFSTDTKTVNGTVYKQLNFNPDANSYFYQDDYTPDPKGFLTLSTAVTPEGLMVVTTSKTPEHLFSTGGLTMDTEWQKSFTSGAMLEVSFINLTNLSSYINDLGLSMGATEEELEPVLTFMAPLKSLLTKTTYDPAGFYSGEFFLNMDMTAFASLSQSLMDLIASFESQDYSEGSWGDYLDVNDAAFFKQYNFFDINENDWFAPYVYHMANLGIMKGYGNDEFRPAQNITRAEFIKTVVSAYQVKYGGNFSANIVPLEGFSDVHSDDWFYSYINQARVMGVITGYNDGSFKPNQAISRAEAVTILMRVWDIDNYYYDEMQNLPFSDVSSTDWFYTSIQKAFNTKLVNGKTPTTFAPADNLSRAESAAIISRFLSYNY